MSANISNSIVEPTLDVVAAAAPTVTPAADAPIVAGRPNAIAVGLEIASTVVKSTLDSLEKLRLAVRNLATSGIDYGDTVARKLTSGSRNLVERFDVAASTTIASTRKVALDAIESRRTGTVAPDATVAAS